MAKNTTQKQAAKQFVMDWTGKGYEKGETQRFWLDLLHNVFGVDDPTKVMQFEIPVKTITKEKGADFIDGYITSTKVLIEQKGSHIDLSAKAKQSDGAELTPYQQARRYATGLPLSMAPRWIVACNFTTFEVHDMEHPNDAPEVIQLADLEKEYYRLAFLVDDGNAHIKKELEVSIKAGEIVGELYDKFLAQYKDPNSLESQKALNKLCVRLVFCLYAEDAGIFGGKNMFHDYLAQFPASMFREQLIKLFQMLDTKSEDRDPYEDERLLAFPYVNGGMFSGDIEIPRINEEIRDLVLQRASDDFDWSLISPTIFGAVFESTLNPETRRAGGMHYTSIENIHKVIDPLFLDDLKAEFKSIVETVHGTSLRKQKLLAFQNKLASFKFLDPACGSGNFLTESYTSLRRLENEALRIIYGSDRVIGEMADPIKVSINQFYGIEINDFACAVAQTALWIAESQMMLETDEIVGFNLDPLPLRKYTNIREGNALRMNWSVWEDSNQIGSQKISPRTPSGSRTPPSAQTITAGPQMPSSAETSPGPRTPPSAQTINAFHSRGYLPHIELKQYQFITFRLHDSVPAKVIRKWKEELEIVETTSSSDPKCIKLRELIEQYADKGYGECYLKDERIAEIVEKTIKFHDGIRYNLIRWCIMPNHVHILVEMKEGWSLSTILQEWKSVSAHKANRILNRKGDFWMPEYFDRFIRDEKHLDSVIKYIDANPVKANLVEEPSDWRWCTCGASGSADALVRKSVFLADEGVREPSEGVREPDEKIAFDYIMGNPPFVGASMMTTEQKEDAVRIFGKVNLSNSIDYVGAWYHLCCKYMLHNTKTRAALVSTNSITQGEQVAALWQPLFDRYNVHIDFAYRTFVWNSEATDKAHVHVVIISFSCDNKSVEKRIFDKDKVYVVNDISPYLTEGGNITIASRSKPLCDVPMMTKGNQPTDGGNLILSAEEREQLIKKDPSIEPFVRRYIGAKDFINNNEIRYCLWFKDVPPHLYAKNPEIMRRLSAVRELRLKSTAEPTRKSADTPYKFFSTPQTDEPYLIIPRVSSERRPYIPIGMMSGREIAADSCSIVLNATLYHFGVLSSSIHMAWLKVVGGRLKSDFRYSGSVVYNCFPWPEASENTHDAIEKTAKQILEARELYLESSLAILYDNTIMPIELRRAHRANDAAVMEAYGFTKNASESEIVAQLFRMYRELTEEKK